MACALHKSVPATYLARLHDVMYADKRRIISYLKKRIPRPCLDVHYGVVKHLPKKGVCCFPERSHPSRKVKLCEMWSCEGCRREHYCSKTSTHKSVKSGTSGKTIVVPVNRPSLTRCEQ